MRSAMGAFRDIVRAATKVQENPFEESVSDEAKRDCEDTLLERALVRWHDEPWLLGTIRAFQQFSLPP